MYVFLRIAFFFFLQTASVMADIAWAVLGKLHCYYVHILSHIIHTVSCVLDIASPLLAVCLHEVRVFIASFS